MKNVATLIALLSCITGTIAAQEGAGRPVFRVGAGLSVPSSPDVFSDYWKIGPHAVGAIGYPVTRGFILEGQVEYNNFTLDDDAILRDLGFSPADVTIQGAAATVLAGTAMAIGRIQAPGSKVAPYFLGGVGFSRLSAGDITASGPGGTATLDGDSETAFSVGFGVGIEIMVTPTAGIFLDGKYSILFTEDESSQYLPFRVGLVVR